MAFCDIKQSLQNIARVSQKETGRDLTTPDWSQLQHGTVFYYKKEDFFQCVVELDIESPNKIPRGQFDKKLDEALPVGQEFIFGFYNKKKISQIIAFATDVMVPERPNPGDCPVFGVKVLISIKREDLEKVPFDEDDPNQEELPQADREIILTTLDLNKRIQNLATIIEAFQFDVEKFDGKVKGIDLPFEGKSVRQFDSALKSLFLSNGRVLRTNEEDIVIVGITNDFRIKYVLSDNGSGLKWLKIGFDLFRLTNSASNQRTIAYVEQMLEIETKPNLSWLIFLKDFTFRPPKILFKKDRVKHKISDKTLKTEEEMEQEQRALLDPQLKSTLVAAASVEQQFVGDQAIGSLASLVNDISSLEEVYSRVLDKVGLKSIVKQAIRCLSQQLPLEEVKRILAIAKLLAALANAPCREFLPTLQAFGFTLESITPFRVAIHREIRKCVNGFTQEAKDGFFRSVSQVAGFDVGVIDDVERVPVDSLFGLPEIDLERIVLLICDTERNSIIDFLSAFGLPISDLSIDLEALIPAPIAPIIQLFDNLPTVDIMAAVSEQIFQAILDALVAALVGMVKSLLQDIVNNCGDFSKVNFGEISFNNLLSRTFGELEGSDALEDAKNQLLGNAVSIDDLAKLPEVVGALGNLIDDLSSVITPNEFGQLLNGQATDETNKLINCMIGSKYKDQLEEEFGNNPAKINELFISLGISLNKAELIDNIAESNVVGPTLENCDLSNDDIKCQLLANKGLSSKECEEQLNKARARKIQRLQDLANLLEKDDVLDGVIPNILCAQGKGAGLIPRDPPSFTFMLDKVIDTIYEGVLMNFNQEVDGFVQAITEPTPTEELRRIVPRKKKQLIDGEIREFRNPEFSRVVASGVPVKDPDDDDGEPVVVFEEDPFSPSFGKTFVAKGLRQILRSFETDPTLFEIEQAGVSLRVPNSLNELRRARVSFEAFDPTPNPSPTTTPPEDFPEGLDFIQPSTTSDPEAAAFAANLDTSIPPEQKLTLTLKRDVGKDNFSFSVDDFSFDGNAQIDPIAKRFIEKNHFSFNPNVSQQESFFAEFVVSIWSKALKNNANSSLISNDLRNLFLQDRFEQILRDLISSLFIQVSNSSLFQADVLSLIEFVPTDLKCHILNIEAIKKKMKEEYEKSECDDAFFPATDGLGKGTLSPMEQTGIEGAVRTMIRLIVFENLLKSIFLFTEFLFDDIFSQEALLTEFLFKVVERDILSMGTNFKTLFFQQALDAFNNKISKKEINETFSNDPNVSIKFFIKNEIGDLMKRVVKLVGNSKNIDLKKVVFEQWLPIFDVHNERRFIEYIPVSINDLRQIEQKNNRENLSTFKLENGQFILEKYLRIEDQPNSSLMNRNEQLFGVVDVQKWTDFINSQNVVLSDHFKKISYGLRLVYVPPISKDDFAITPKNDLFENILKSTSKDLGNKEKAFDLLEKFDVFDVGGQRRTFSRKVHSFPLASVEIEEDLGSVSSQTSFSSLYDDKLDELLEKLIGTDEASFLFKFCFPVHRIFSMGLIYSNLYLSNISSVQNLFNGTKQSLKSVFEALQNSGDYTYSDQFVQESQGNAGLANDATSNIGKSVAAMAAKTPFLIVKGIAETLDPNIIIAKLIVEQGKKRGKNIPFVAASLGQLPMNVFPPPFGLGPPITPAGFFYLANSLNDIFKDKEAKDLDREEKNLKQECEEQ